MELAILRAMEYGLFSQLFRLSTPGMIFWAALVFGFSTESLICRRNPHFFRRIALPTVLLLVLLLLERLSGSYSSREEYFCLMFYVTVFLTLVGTLPPFLFLVPRTGKRRK